MEALTGPMPEGSWENDRHPKTMPTKMRQNSIRCGSDTNDRKQVVISRVSRLKLIVANLHP